MDADIRQVIEAYFKAIGVADADGLASLFADEAHFEDPVGGAVLVGPDGIRKFHRGLTRAWRQLVMRPTSIFVRGDRGAATWQAQGLTTSDKAISFEGINTFRIDGEGRIGELYGYWDMEAVIAQF